VTNLLLKSTCRMFYVYCRRTCNVLHGLRGISVVFRVFPRNDELVLSGTSFCRCTSQSTEGLTQQKQGRPCISAQRTKASRKLKDRIEDIWTVPNLLSTARICLAPVIGYLVINHSYTSALVLFAAAGVSDWLDGYIARHFKNQRSMLGTALDPFADKFLISILTISLAYIRIIPSTTCGLSVNHCCHIYLCLCSSLGSSLYQSGYWSHWSQLLYSISESSTSSLCVQ
jgi:phosphatidylglycerophosphate synthase